MPGAHSQDPVRRRWTLVVPMAALLLLNFWIAHRLFYAEFVSLQQNEAVFIALARIYRDHWHDLSWFPYFNAGMPIENAYQPLLPAITALLSGITGMTVGRALHVVMGLAYCFGPVTLCWLMVEWSGQWFAGFACGLLFSLLSPSAMLFAPIRAISGGPFVPQRFFNIVYFAEDPHILALALLPVALVFLRRVAVRRDRVSFALATVSCSAVVLTNAFGAAMLAIGAACTVLALGEGFLSVAAVGVVAWALASPWLPPSLLATIQSISLSARGQFEQGWQERAGLAVLALLALAVWWISRRWQSRALRFVCLMTPWMCGFPIAYYFFGVTLAPQAHRYQLELEAAVCVVCGLLLARAFRSGDLARSAVVLALAALVVVQAPAYRSFARSHSRPLDVTRTPEYRLVQWLDRNLKGQRAMVSGSAEWLLNVYSDNPQMSGGHDQSTPNFTQQVAMYQLYTGMNAGEQDAEISILWLKAFGNQAITMPRLEGADVYKPYVHGNKFEGVLPVLWRNPDDTVYQVPQRSTSLFHVIPVAAVAGRRPVHGLDVGPVKTYVAALEDESLPLVRENWQGESRVSFEADLQPGQVVSIQMNYAPGWKAHVNGAARSMRSDGLGLMVLDPQCTGKCQVEMEFGATAEGWVCRALSGMAALLLAWFGVRGFTGVQTTPATRPPFEIAGSE